MTLPVLPLRDMSDRHRGLARALAASYLEAARVSLDRHHAPPQEFAMHKRVPMLLLKYWQYWWSGSHLTTAVEERGQTRTMLREMAPTRVPLP